METLREVDAERAHRLQWGGVLHRFGDRADALYPMGVCYGWFRIPPDRMMEIEMTANETRTARTYEVQGMTCDHCRAAVDEEVREVAGVTGVDVDLASGRLEIRGTGFADADVARAVEEAGYRLTERR